MTTPAPRPNRRIGDRQDSPAERQRHIVRVISADPILLGWLGGFISRRLARAADHLALRGHKEAAQDLRRIADGYRSGEISPFSG